MHEEGNIAVSNFFSGFTHDDVGHDASDSDGGRSSAWATSNVLGKFRALLPLRQRNLCAYIDIVKARHDRMLIVSEHYRRNLTDWDLISTIRSGAPEKLFDMMLDVCSGLAYINQFGFVHGCLAPELITFDEISGCYKIVDFGKTHVADYGSLAPLHFHDVKYLAPEVLVLGPHPSSRDLRAALRPATDMWSLGVLLCDILQIVDLSSQTCKDWIKLVLECSAGERSDSAINCFADKVGYLEKFRDIPESLKSLLELMLLPSSSQRISPAQAVEKCPCPSSTERNGKTVHMCTAYDPLLGVFPPVSLRCKTVLVSSQLEKCREDALENPLLNRSLDEIYNLWKLAGGDVLSEMKFKGYAREPPPILTLPKVSSGEFLQMGNDLHMEHDPDRNFIFLDIVALKEKLDTFPREMYFPLLLREKDAWEHMGDFLNEAQGLGLAIRENNLIYQLYRQILFHRLLSCYPFTLPQIRKECLVDIPPLYRARVWAALLEIRGDVAERYGMIDKDSSCSSDRQIEVDIPRCHQYNLLMASSEAHTKLKRMLKAWIADHPQFVYWQGLDSLCAPFIYLNFSDEGLAYACLSRFVEKYVHKFFLKDNTPVIQEYLAVFSRLMAFHEPVLHTHLTGIGFLPELYSIPWFLTMFTHVFPLHKIFQLWDQLLLGDDSFPLFIGLALLHSLKDKLLGFGFNECILLFSDFPDLNIQQCLKTAKEMFRHTPKSATYRVHANSAMRNGDYPDCDLTDSLNKSAELENGKQEVCPRITWEELQWIQSRVEKDSGKTSVAPLLIDIRSSDDYNKGTLPLSINIPFLNAFGADGDLLPSPESQVLSDRRGKLVIVFDGRCTNADKFASELVRLGFSHVCTLHQGIEQLKSSGFVTVPPSF
ncbi:TBC domain-containing protein kinase-like protein [Paramacrobiotus metropolitanus]|uniref:TBC domain-containing protein kinase-like protein n=1 Tax=Paramacrobiotus metropolitanus TaxID=2943436 RepID=UPI0024463B15|nr:TBC domain-containing protein kinase-like protein [Paramacrobiotus metropolitanus]